MSSVRTKHHIIAGLMDVGMGGIEAEQLATIAMDAISGCIPNDEERRRRLRMNSDAALARHNQIDAFLYPTKP